MVIILAIWIARVLTPNHTIMGFKKFPLRRKKSRSKDDARFLPADEAPSITQTAPPVLAEYDHQQQR